MKIVVAIAAIILVGCDRGGNSPTQSSAGEAAPDSKIVLDCNGQRFDRNSKKWSPASYLIEVGSNGAPLNYYDPERKIFVPSACGRNFGKCIVEVNDDLIIETGIMNADDGSLMWKITTEINRRTGKMRDFSYMPGIEEIVDFEGGCVKGSAPQKPEQKF